MSRITRALMTIFGASAGTDQIAKFGSLAAGTPAFTTDPKTIQALSNYAAGWFDAVVGGNSPAIEDMNALCYLFAYQLSYLLQAGVPEWDTDTTYYVGDIVQNGAGMLYVSYTNSNAGNALTDGANWNSLPTLTTNSVGADRSILTGTSLTYTNLVLASAADWTVDSGGYLAGITAITVNGTLTINGTARVL